MRIVLDLQACQSDSRYRGIGRNAISLASQMIRVLESRGHQVIVLLNGAYPDEGASVRSMLGDVNSGAHFVEFHTPLPCAAGVQQNRWRQRAAELLREYVLAYLEPHFIHMAQLVADGWSDNTVASIGELGVYLPTALTQHDLIPLVMSDIYLPPGEFREYYLRKLSELRKADLLLAVSEYSRREAIDLLNISQSKIVNISSAVSSHLVELEESRGNYEGTLKKFGLTRGYFLYAPGGFDARKNVEGLIEAFALIPEDVRKKHPLVIASKLHPGCRERILSKLTEVNLSVGEVVLTDYVPDEELVDLYLGCGLYVFPSVHEGFGLPVLEAMSLGVAVVASNRTGIAEAVGLAEALFDPYSIESISEAMLKGILDNTFRQKLKAHARVHSRKFSWEKSALIAVDAVELKHRDLIDQGWKPVSRKELPTCEELLSRLSSLRIGIVPTRDDLQQFRQCFDGNKEMARSSYENIF